MDVKSIAVVVSLALAGCAKTPPPHTVAPRTLPGSDGREHALVDHDAKLTVIEFFSAHCPVQKAHDAHLREIGSIYAQRNVTFVLVDSEAGATVERDRDEARARGYSFPILIDKGGVVARELHAVNATYTLVVDREGLIVYRGGIDSDRTHVTGDTSTSYLREAIDDALLGRAPRVTEEKVLGCALTLD